MAISGVVVAGGSSRRMGRDKRWLRIDGAPLLHRVVTTVQGIVDDVHIVVATDTDRERVADLITGATIDVDLRPGHGPLAGIETALTHAKSDQVIVVACDHPWLDPEVLALLPAALDAQPDVEAAAIVTDHGPQPLLAAYRRRAVTTVAGLLDAGQRRARVIFDELPYAAITPQMWRQIDPDGCTVRDVDTPDDLAQTDGPGRHRTASVTVHAVRDAETIVRRDRVVDEEPLQIRAAGHGQEPTTVVTTLRTRGHDEELAAGWLHSEGLLPDRGPHGITGFETGDPFFASRPEDHLTVHLSHPLDLDAAAARHATATASCGVCGRASIDELAARATPLDVDATMPTPWELVAALPDRLRDTQELFTVTGAIHATGIFHLDGRLQTVREDVGRHNALDAAIGAHILAGDMPLTDRIVVLSGRVGFELVAKAAMAGAPLLVAVGAPTDLAVTTAERFGITLAGFVRNGDGNVYTHPERLTFPAGA